MKIDKQYIEQNYKLFIFIINKVGSSLNEDDKADLLHDLVVKLLQSEADIEEEGASAYITRAAKNLLHNKRRDSRTDALTRCESLDAPMRDEEGNYTLHDRVQGNTMLPDEQVSIDNDYVEDKVESITLKYKSQIERLCSYMKKGRGLVFYYRYVLGHKPKEIAKETGYSIDKVKSLLKRAVGDAFRIMKHPLPLSSRSSISLQSMYLTSIPEDRDMYPFKMYYSDGKSLFEIAEELGRSVESVNRSITKGRILLEEKYGLSIRD